MSCALQTPHQRDSLPHVSPPKHWLRSPAIVCCDNARRLCLVIRQKHMAASFPGIAELRLHFHV